MEKLVADLITDEELRALDRVIDLAIDDLQTNPDAELMKDVEQALSFQNKFQKWRERMASQPLLKRSRLRTP